MQFATPEYVSVLRAMHDQHPWGTKGFHHIDKFIEFYHLLGCQNILDYGSGTETVRLACERMQPPIPVQCYDPGVEGREALPEPSDFVVCTDVLEHIEPPLIDGVIKHVYDLTIKGAYLNIALTKAKRILPDGRNAHLIIKPCEWWLKKLRLYAWREAQVEPGQKRLTVWLRK